MRRIAFALPAAAALAAAALCSAAVPTPADYFGHKMGADRTVLDWDRVVSYFHELGRDSDRVRVQELGKSTEGRPFLMAVIAAPQTLRNLDRYSAIQRRLADPRLTSEAEAERLIAEGKAVVAITCSIHSTELASTHSAVEFAWRLATGSDARIRRILDSTIVLLVPSLNPDGLDLVTRWYRRTLGTSFEGTAPPELYQKYVGHDNNRDWYFFTQAETRLAVAGVQNAWHPQITYDLHEQGAYAARMFVPPWLDPIDPNVDPILAQECNMVGAGVASDLTAAGKTGVVINALYDFWSAARAYSPYHGGLRVLSESASVRLASPVTIRRDQIRAGALGYSPLERSWNYLEPWLGGEWHLRDIVDDQLIAMESVLSQVASRREDWLRNFYRVGRRALERRSPEAFVIPATQRDPGAARTLLEKLAFGLVEVDRASEPFESGDARYPAGTYLIRTAQPYGAFARTLLADRRYPDLRGYGSAPRPPYDVTTQMLPLLMGVDVRALETLPAVRLDSATRFPCSGLSSASGLAASDTDSWVAINRIWREGGAVWRDPTTGDFFPSADAEGRRVRMERPRIGVYKSFVPAADEGWTRWLLEAFGFAYESVSNRAIREGALHGRFDVLVFPDQAPTTIAAGYLPSQMPAEFTGGLGEPGAAALERFARDGGVLVFLNQSARYAANTLGLGMKNAIAGLSDREFYSPGSLLNARVDPASPLALGMPARLAIWSEQSPAWDISAGSSAHAVARYPDADVLASGWLLGEARIAGKAALVDCPLGSGRAILFGLRPQYRGQSYATFPLFFNALLPRRSR